MTCTVNAWVQHAASSESPRGFSLAFIAGGWPYINTTLQTQILSLGPGLDEIMFWLAFGHPASGDFDLASYQACQATPGLELVADQSAFVTAIVALVQATGVRKIWFYEGYLGGHAATWAGLTTAQKQAKIAANLAPYLAVQSALVALGYSDPVGMLFDTLNWPAEGFAADNWTLVIPYVEANFSAAGAEPWPSDTNPRLSDPDWMTVVDEDDQVGMEAGAGAAVYPWSGPVCPFVIGVTTESHETRAVRALRRFEHVAIEPHSGLTVAALKAACDSLSGSSGSSGSGSGTYTPPADERPATRKRARRRRPAPAPNVFAKAGAAASRRRAPSVTDSLEAFRSKAAEAVRAAAEEESGLAFRVDDDGSVIAESPESMVMEFGTELREPKPWASRALAAASVELGRDG